jgi:ribosome-associated protein
LSYAQEAALSNPRNITQLVLDLLEAGKAEDIICIDLAGKSSLADAMIVAQGTSNRHVASVSERLIQGLKENLQIQARVEGLGSCDWVLVDAGDVIVHIFRPEVRAFYNLEKMWSQDRPTE